MAALFSGIPAKAQQSNSAIEANAEQPGKSEAAAAGPAQVAETALLDPCLDYGRSFINTKATFNSPRFVVESRCRVMDKSAGKTVEYLQCALCKSEHTFAERDLFQKDNYDFLPVFSEQEGIIFRRKVRVGEPYRDVRPIDQWWDGTEPRLRTFRGRVLKSPEEIFAAMQDGKLIVGQTEIRNEETGQVAVIEYPVKTINFQRDSKAWQVDTGPVVLPDLTVPPEQWSHTFKLAHIAFRTPDWADFIFDQPTPVSPDQNEADESKEDTGQDGCLTYHYSGHVHHVATNVLLALDEE
jgi:hypothetical protein